METKDKIVFGVLSLVIILSSLKGCASINGNEDIIDTKKSYNVAIDENNNAISITNFVSYSDYDDNQIQFVTQDGLVILTSTIDTQLLSQYDFNLVKDYATCLAGGNVNIVYSYDELQGLNTNMDKKIWNKNIFEVHSTYNYALIESDNSITIAEIDSWHDYESNDKIQITLTNGTTILKDIKNIKLLDDSNAQENSVYNYVLSLVGDESKIKYHSTQKQLKK